MSAAVRFSVFLLIFAAGAFAQAQISSGDISGVVTDPSGARIKGVKVTATEAERGITRIAESDDSGDYRLVLLPPGTYRVRAEAPGFAVKNITGVQVRVGDIVTLPIDMVLSQVSTEVMVEADAAVVESERTQQSNTIQTQQIRNLPINRRNYLDFALLTPGVVETNDLVDGTDYRVVQAPQSGLSFGGSNGRGNSFAIDGVENYINSGGVRPSVSQEAVSEFQINRNSYSAEFGGAFGGAINIITRSGTNEVHGNLFGFLRNRRIQARNYFDPNPDGSAYTRTQAGATFGAPIVKDRTFLFAALERLDRNETSFVPILQDRSVFSQLTTSQQQLVDFFNASGVPALRGLAAQAGPALIATNYPRTVALFDRNSGNFPFSEDSTQVSVRLDHRFTDSHNIFFRGNFAKDFSQNAQLGALLGYNRGRDIDQLEGTAMLSDTFVLNERWVSETRAMFANYTLDVTTIDPNGPQIDITGYGLFGREIFLPSKVIERHYQVMQTFSYHSGAHNVRFGADVNPVRDNVKSETFFSGRFSFGENVPLGSLLNTLAGDPNFATSLGQTLTQLGQSRLVPNLQQPITSLQAYNLGLPTYYQQGFGDTKWLGWTKRYNFFVQDTLRLHRRLTMNLGARYELEINPAIVGTDPNNIGPRMGLAWTVTGDAKTVLRAGYGLFYSQNNLQIANVADTLSGSYIQQVFVPLTGAPGLNNQLTGRPLTSSDIYQRLLAQGVIGNRAITRQDLAQFGVTPNPNLPFAVVFGIVDDWRNPYSQQASLEIERAIGTFSISAAYNFNRGVALPRIIDRNLRYGPPRPDGQPTFTFANPLIFQQNIFEPTANSFYHAGVLQLNKRFSRNWALNAHYTLSKAMDEVTDFNTDFQPHDQLNAKADRALSSFHQKHRFVLSSVFESPLANTFFGGWVLSPIIVASSGRPFNVLTGFDNLNDRHPNTHRPLRAGRNLGRGPDYITFDFRLSRRFALGGERRNIELIAEGFNLLNRTNFRSLNNTVGNITVEQLPRPLVGGRGVPTNPLSFTSAFDPRQFQFGLKIHY
jgi:hypothetical protein